MAFRLFGKEVSGPFTIPSGIVTVTYDTAWHFAKTCPEIGIVTTKSIGPSIREGNREPVYAQVRPQSKNLFANAVGLAGPGCALFAAELASAPKLPPKKFLLISIFGKDTEEFVQVAKTLAPYADGFELNFSCPHAEGHGMELCSTPGLAANIVIALRAAVPNIPILPKLSPNLSNDALCELVTQLCRAGADGFSAINTVGPLPSDVLSNKRGGTSGPQVLARALEVVRLIRNTCNEFAKIQQPSKPLVIIGMGGVQSCYDVASMREAGADFIGVGTSLTGLNTAQCRDALRMMSTSPPTTASNAAMVALQSTAADMVFHPFRIVSIQKINPKLAIFTLDQSIACDPGQFIMVFVPGVGEKPFAPAWQQPCTLVVRDVGILTKHILNHMTVGDVLQIRGVYGTSFTVPPRRVHTMASHLHPGTQYVLVGGGTGIAPLLLLAQCLSHQAVVPKANLHVFLGGRSATELYFLDEFNSLATLHCATDDGSSGENPVVPFFKGTCVDLLALKLLEWSAMPNASTKYYFYNCGPERMMSAAVAVQERYPFFVIEASIERYMKCGVGICGVCSCDGLRMCVDGPIMGYEFLSNSLYFGKKHRAKTTQLIDW
eukprot:PhF_6_TR43623/c0_g1_i1/m.67014